MKSQYFLEFVDLKTKQSKKSVYISLDSYAQKESLYIIRIFKYTTEAGGYCIKYKNILFYYTGTSTRSTGAFGTNLKLKDVFEQMHICIKKE